MTPILAIVLSDNADSSLVQTTIACCKLGGIEAISSPQAKVAELVKDADEELVHIIPAGTLVLPSFYEAIKTSLEHTGRDYAVCHSVLATPDETLVRDGTNDLVKEQMVVRKWVLQEMGIPQGDCNDLFHRIASQYRGIDVPFVLIVERQP